MNNPATLARAPAPRQEHAEAVIRTFVRTLERLGTERSGKGAALAREAKFLPQAVAAVAADGTFEGYASLFGLPDLGKDVVMPGAFAESLARRGAGGVRMLWQHDPAQPIGRWLAITEDARGLKVRGELNLAVARGREVRALLRDGGVDGLSIGFRVERATPDRAAGVRRLEKVDLWEISVVTFPMLPDARVSGVKRSLTSPGPGEVSFAAAIRRARLRLFG
jgi:HK97 family phage prohead protease